MVCASYPFFLNEIQRYSCLTNKHPGFVFEKKQTSATHLGSAYLCNVSRYCTRSYRIKKNGRQRILATNILVSYLGIVHDPTVITRVRIRRYRVVSVGVGGGRGGYGPPRESNETVDRVSTGLHLPTIRGPGDNSARARPDHPCRCRDARPNGPWQALGTPHKTQI